MTSLCVVRDCISWLPKTSSKNCVFVTVDELDSAENWVQAENNLEKIIDQAIKTVPVRKIRLYLDNVKKQIAVMFQVMAKRNLAIHQVR